MGEPDPWLKEGHQGRNKLLSMDNKWKGFFLKRKGYAFGEEQ